MTTNSYKYGKLVNEGKRQTIWFLWVTYCNVALALLNFLIFIVCLFVCFSFHFLFLFTDNLKATFFSIKFFYCVFLTKFWFFSYVHRCVLKDDDLGSINIIINICTQININKHIKPKQKRERLEDYTWYFHHFILFSIDQLNTETW